MLKRVVPILYIDQFPFDLVWNIFCWIQPCFKFHTNMAGILCLLCHSTKRRVEECTIKGKSGTRTREVATHALHCGNYCSAVYEALANARTISPHGKASPIQYDYIKWGTHARVFSQTLANGNSKNEISHRNGRARVNIWKKGQRTEKNIPTA